MSHVGSDDSSQGELFEVAAVPGTPVGKKLRLFSSEGKRAVFFGPTAVYLYDEADKEAEAACIVTLSRAGLAKDVDIATAFGVHRNTVGRMSRRFEHEGLAAAISTRRGPKGPWKATAGVNEIIAAHAELPGKALQELVGRQTGTWLSLSHIYGLAAPYKPRQLQLEGTRPQPDQGQQADFTDDDGENDDAQALESTGPDGTVGPAEGPGGGPGAFEPPVELPGTTSGRYMGLALYYPALAAVGLVDIARQVYSLPRSARLGVRATVLCLFFMTVLSKTTIEAAKHLRRAELGVMAGSTVAPCVKTLRRKLAALVEQSQAVELGTLLARHWVSTGLVATAYLYVDGHMKAYSGKARLAEVWNSQRRMPLPGVHTYFVGDQVGRPLLFLAEELSANLAKAMPSVIGEIRKVVGPGRHFCVVFDRGGYDGKLFSWLAEEKVDFITYERGDPGLADSAFSRHEARVEGRRVRFVVAEDEITVARSGPWRRVVVRAKDGHQTPILTSLGAAVPAVRVAALMFARWRQENFFKYMGEHHGLDNIVSYETGPAGPGLTVPNPARKALDRRVREARKALDMLKAELGTAVLDEPMAGGRSVHGLKVAQRGKVKTLRGLEAKIDALVAERKRLPERVSAAEAGGREVTRREAKAIIDRIKIAAYNAEEWLLDRLVLHYGNAHDVRDLLRAFAELSGTIETTPNGVMVNLDPPDTPLHRQALRGLVDDLNALGATFPGTNVPVTYQVRMHHSELVA